MEGQMQLFSDEVYIDLTNLTDEAWLWAMYRQYGVGLAGNR